ncbi:hypothetical protein HY636_01080 [Candidatus Woesearchaeota archaeon]|nr:hypothetical protein [Candidatus Woesearchaeota archaeon]
MILVHIKGSGSDDGLDDLIRGYTARRPDERKEIEVVGEHKFGEVLRKYERCLEMNAEYKLEDPAKAYDYIKENVKEVLTPADINAFLQATIIYEDNKWYSRRTGEFISQLIQNSYEAGYNNFILNTTKSIIYLGLELKGCPERRISVYIDGDTGIFCGEKASYSSFIINGNMDGGGCTLANNSAFTINGTIVQNLFGHNATSCIFKTSNKETLGKLIDYAGIDSKNKYYFIHPDGTEELMRMF